MRLYLCLLILLCGCGQKSAKNAASTAPTFDPAAELNMVREGLRKPHPDPDHLRSVLQRLGNVIANDPDRKPTPLTDESVQRIKKAVGLNDADVAEITRSDFTALDGAVLDQALLFRDIAKSLGVEDQDISTKTSAALAWVTRHVVLADHAGTPFPPEFVVTQGRGTALERIYVYLALMQQLGLDAYAIGDDGSGHDPGKLWGVAVGDTKVQIVVDPRIGLALPNKSPGNYVSLAELQAQPELLKKWRESGYDVSAERIKAAKLYWGLPASTFATRLQAVEALFTGNDLRLTANVATLPSLVAWDPRTVGTPLRVLAEFTPEGQGGTERADRLRSGQYFGRRQRSQGEMLPWHGLPQELLQLPPEEKLRAQILGAYAFVAGQDQVPGLAESLDKQEQLLSNYKRLRDHEKEITDDRQRDDIARELLAAQRSRGGDTGPTLRELLLRGQLNDANRAMEQLRKQLQMIREQHAAISGEQAVRELVAIIDAAIAAQKAGNAQGVAMAIDRLSKFKDVAPALANVQALAAAQMTTKLAFLTAVGKHDQAEVRSRRQPANKADAWQSATKLWESYLSNNPDAFEAAHARRCFAEALRNSGDETASKAQFDLVAAGKTHPLDKVACTILAK